MYIGNITLLIPVLYLAVCAIVVLIVGVFADGKKDGKLEHYVPAHYLAPALCVPALILAGWVVVQSMFIARDPNAATTMVTLGKKVLSIPANELFVSLQGAQLTVDPFAAIFSFVAILGTLVVLLISIDHFGEDQPHKAEYYALMMFSACAASLAAMSSDLISLYLSIEFLSLSSYVLAAFSKNDRKSGEAGLKYFLYGAACSATMIYGMSILFGASGGHTGLAEIALGLGSGASQTAVVWVGVMFTLVGFGFKLALVPFHFWAPDTYEGAPTPVTAFLSVVSKAAGLAVIIRFMMVVGLDNATNSIGWWYWVLAVLTVLSMFYGNLLAIPQKNIKRMLAYSGIAQVGYMMVGVLAAMREFMPNVPAVGANVTKMTSGIAGPDTVGSGAMWGLPGVIIYVVAYLLMNLGAFAVVIAMGKRLGSDKISTYSGLMKRSPFYAISLAVFLISLSGIPPLAGFLGKFYIFGGAIRVGLNGYPELVALAVFGIINSVISVYYYLNIVRVMFFEKSSEESPVTAAPSVSWTVAALVFLTVALIVFFGPLSHVATEAVTTANPVYMLF